MLRTQSQSETDREMSTIRYSQAALAWVTAYFSLILSVTILQRV